MHVTEQLPAYALGCLDDDEVGVVARHLATCAACQAQLAAYREITGRLAWAAPGAEPPAGLKQRVLGQAEAERATAPAGAARQRAVAEKAAPAWWARLSGLWRGTAPAWGVAALVLVLLLVVSNLWWWQRTEERAPAGDMRLIAMLGTDAAPKGSGTLVISADGEYGTLVVDGLPVLEPDHTYQLWLIRDGQRTSGGLFDVSSHGYGALVVSSPDPLASYDAFGVTVEPAGGSPGPTGAKVLGSTE